MVDLGDGDVFARTLAFVFEAAERFRGIVGEALVRRTVTKIGGDLTEIIPMVERYTGGAGAPPEPRVP